MFQFKENDNISYTIGNTETYDNLLKTGITFKTPKNNDYKGGIVFKTFAQAQNYIIKNKLWTYSIYKLKMPNNFNDCCYFCEKDNNFYLLKKSEILILEK